MIRSSLIATKRTPLATRGMVVAEHPLGAEVGASILQKGGNAIDAAVATAFAMPVVEPFMSSLAGGGTMLVHLARRGETLCVDFNVEAPAAAYDGCYELMEGTSTAIFPWRLVVDDANVFGPRSVAVPGSVAGLALAWSGGEPWSCVTCSSPPLRWPRTGSCPTGTWPSTPP